jgi:hypothetical protein
MASVPQFTDAAQSKREWKDVLEMILPLQGEWTDEEYLVLTDHRNQLVEFTDGFLEVLPMPTQEHQMLLKFLFLAFHACFEFRGATYCSRRFGYGSDQANSANPISCSCSRPTTRAGKTVFGPAPTWPLRS